MINQIPPSPHEFVTPGQLNAAASKAAHDAELEKKRAAEAKKVKERKFTDFLKKPAEVLEAEAGLPPEIIGMEYEKAVTYLLDAVTLAAEQFKNNPYTNAFSEYRTKVSQFLKFVVKNSYDVETVQGTITRRHPKPKKMHIIKIVDENLDQLARDILYNQSNQIALLAKVDEINGLLVDLVS